MEVVSDERKRLDTTVLKARAKLKGAAGERAVAEPLRRLPRQKREMYEHLFSLIYECS